MPDELEAELRGTIRQVAHDQAITDALVSAGRKRGVQYETSFEVDRIIVEDGRAAGVELVDGAGSKPTSWSAT